MRIAAKTFGGIASLRFTEPHVGCGAAIVVAHRILLLRRRTEPEAGA